MQRTLGMLEGGRAMVDGWVLVLLVLLAVLVGATIPVLVQARATLRALQKTLERSSPRLDEALVATTSAAGRLDRMVTRLEEGGRLEELVDGVAAASRAVSHLRDGVRVASAVGAAVGPAIAAAIHALRDERETAPAAPNPTPNTERESTQAEPGRQVMP
jgi:hypothetical protein